MRRRIPLRTAPLQAALTALATTAAAAGLAGAGLAGASAGTNAATPLPAHVFAPYFEGYDTSGGSPSTLSQESGVKFLSLAFLQTASAGSCTAYWEGDTSMPIAQSSFGSDISAIQAAGGNVIPSFGGYGADSTGTDIADSCTNVSQIAATYESVITTYNVPRIDLDIEAASLTNTAGIDRRDKAVAQVEAWAKSKSSAQLWAMIGVTEMPGIDDYGPDETFWKAQAPELLSWADSVKLNTISFWALQRDNGGCPGTKGAGTCSGIYQPTWYFSHQFEPFTS
jgi:hypothetical protein